MDSEKFDKVVLDLLYDELDELTRASAMRHVEQSSPARALYSELRATREVGAVPLVDPPDDLETRILAAEQAARAERPLKERFGSFVSILASYTMRPQLAMAALLMLMLGTSLLLLRARPGPHETMQVTERGETVDESVAIVKTPEQNEEAAEGQAHGVVRSWKEKAPAESEAPSDKTPGRAARDDLARAAPAAPTEAKRSAASEGAGKAEESKDTDAYGDAMLAYRGRRYGEAVEQFDEIAGSGGPNAAEAALFAARSVQQQSGCAAATSRYERVASMYSGTTVAHEAMWLAAECYRQSGQNDDARRAYRTLVDTEYGDKSKAALLALGDSFSDTSVAAKASKAGAASKPATAAPAKPSSPAATTEP